MPYLQIKFLAKKAIQKVTSEECTGFWSVYYKHPILRFRRDFGLWFWKSYLWWKFYRLRFCREIRLCTIYYLLWCDFVTGSTNVVKTVTKSDWWLVTVTVIRTRLWLGHWLHGAKVRESKARKGRDMYIINSIIWRGSSFPQNILMQSIWDKHIFLNIWDQRSIE